MIGYAALAALAALGACSSSKAPTPPAPATDVTAFFSPSVTGVMRGSEVDFPMIDYLSSILGSPPACWMTLRKAIKTAYQLEVPGNGTYFVLEGALPRAEVESCVTTALAPALGVKVGHDGELATFETQAGTAYVAWRGPVVIAGRKQNVTEALVPAPPEIARTWRERLARMPQATLAMWRQDEMIHNLFGVPTTSYQLVIDRVQKTPRPDFAGRVIADYATAEDAATAARRIDEGEIEPALAAPPELAQAVKRMRVTRTGTSVEAAFDLAMFDGLDFEMLQAWIGGLAAQQAR